MQSVSEALYSDEQTDVFLKLFVLLYADDTVLLAESVESLQNALNAMADYCDQYKLSLNTSKTKVMIFSRGKIRNLPQLTFSGSPLEVVFEYVYLGITFSYNGKFTKAKLRTCENARRAMFALLRKAAKVCLPIDLQLQLFDSVVAPVLLYGSEVWAVGDLTVIERLHLRFCKMLLKVNKCTTTNMVYGELGRFPLHITATVRTLGFWYRLCENTNKLSCKLYRLLYRLDSLNIYTSDWIAFVKKALNDTGFSGFWNDQNVTGSIEWFKTTLRIRLRDQFIQTWASQIFNSTKCSNYRMFKENFEFEKYLLQLPPRLRLIMSKFRCRNHRLPIETATFSVDNDPNCTRCNLTEPGDEFHYLFKCPAFTTDRKKYLKPYCYKRPSTLKFSSLMHTNGLELNKLAKFIQIIYTATSQ